MQKIGEISPLVKQIFGIDIEYEIAKDNREIFVHLKKSIDATKEYNSIIFDLYDSEKHPDTIYYHNDSLLSNTDKLLRELDELYSEFDSLSESLAESERHLAELLSLDINKAKQDNSKIWYYFVEKFLDRMIDNIDLLKHWCTWNREREKAESLGLSGVVSLYSSEQITYNDIKNAFLKGFFKTVSEYILSCEPAINNFSKDNFICAFAGDIRNAEVNKLAKLIEDNDFALVHTLHTQTSATLLVEAMAKVQKKTPVWVNTVWGSDLFLHQWIAESRCTLVNILPKIDYYWGEGIRDYSLAKSLGFAGEFLPPVPAFGGFDMEKLERLEYIKPSQRKRILIKGYMNVVGRAEIAFHALERCVELLDGYEIVIFSFENVIITTIGSIFSNKYNIPVTAISGITYEEILQLHLSSRMCIALSTSDGLPASFIESMACGEFPIQSRTSMCDEWAVDGENALFVDAYDVNQVEQAVRFLIGCVRFCTVQNKLQL